MTSIEIKAGAWGVLEVLIGFLIPEQIEQELIKFLKDRSKTFTCKHEDMTDIDENILTPKFNNDPY